MASTTANDNEDDLYNDADISTAPFTSQTAYPKGLSRKPITFVSATSTETNTTTSVPTSSTPSISTQYLSIVFPNGIPDPTPTHPICPTCNAQITEPTPRLHYLSFAHQHALPRTPTPSSIDRSRMGYKYLEKHGFDVDARQGLGASGKGILYPVKAAEKKGKEGIGVEKPEEVVDRKGERLVSGRKDERSRQKLDAGKVRKLVKREKVRDERLRRAFYQDEKVSEYLGELEKV